ncbi:MAG: response regulator [Magnetococcus sp. YQC-5]
MENSVSINSVVKSSLYSNMQIDHTPAEHKPIVVAVSRNLGSNGGKIAELLAARLKVQCFGHSMIDELIIQTKTTKTMMSIMDEKLPTPLDSFIYSLFTSADQSVSNYYKNIIKMTLNIAKNGGVIIGRGARLILAKDPNVFRIHIEGSRDICIKRVAQRDGLGLEEAKKKIADTEKERSRFLKGLYKIFPNNRTYYDLVINSDKIEPQHAVDLIINAMNKMGHHVNKNILKVEPASQKQNAKQLSNGTWNQAQKINEWRVGLHFLIVEDEMEFFYLIKGWLANATNSKDSNIHIPSLKLTHAPTFKEAELFLAQNKYDLILLDLNLSDSYGYDETFMRINQSTTDTPIIIFTGIDDDQKSIQAVAEGAQDYLVKGQVNKKNLIRSIKHALSRYQILKTYINA